LLSIEKFVAPTKHRTYTVSAHDPKMTRFRSPGQHRLLVTSHFTLLGNVTSCFPTAQGFKGNFCARLRLKTSAHILDEKMDVTQDIVYLTRLYETFHYPTIFMLELIWFSCMECVIPPPEWVPEFYTY